jgi:hypothetical protein
MFRFVMSQISSWQREEEEANPPAQNFDEEISDIKKNIHSFTDHYKWLAVN